MLFFTTIPTHRLLVDHTIPITNNYTKVKGQTLLELLVHLILTQLWRQLAEHWIHIPTRSNTIRKRIVPNLPGGLEKQGCKLYEWLTGHLMIHLMIHQPSFLLGSVEIWELPYQELAALDLGPCLESARSPSPLSAW